MKNPLIYNVIFGCTLTILSTTLSAQKSTASALSTYKTNKKSQNYQQLLDLGYSDQEIFEDLGNANFLSNNYEAAIFWYKKLKTVSRNGALSKNYKERYQFALEKMGAKEVAYSSNEKNWLADVKKDYNMDRRSKKDDRFHDINLNQREEVTAELLQTKNQGSFMQEDPIAITEDGKTAYFSKKILVKPATGLFSKKESIHKIYKANKINGQWKNIQQVNLCPKNYSTLHPTVSKDGNRLFFASNMPGTFGKYDIYVSDIRKDGSLGIAKNLGEKVNTKANDLYPNHIGGNTLFFASEGREGYGGLDIFMVEVHTRKVGIAINLGETINSKGDDLAIKFTGNNGMGYVMSNRGKDKNDVRQVAFSYARKNKRAAPEKEKYNIKDAFANDAKIDYSSIVFEDE